MSNINDYLIFVICIVDCAPRLFEIKYSPIQSLDFNIKFSNGQWMRYTLWHVAMRLSCYLKKNDCVKCQSRAKRGLWLDWHTFHNSEELWAEEEQTVQKFAGWQRAILFKNNWKQLKLKSTRVSLLVKRWWDLHDCNIFGWPYPSPLICLVHNLFVFKMKNSLSWSYCKGVRSAWHKTNLTTTILSRHISTLKIQSQLCDTSNNNPQKLLIYKRLWLKFGYCGIKT